MKFNRLTAASGTLALAIALLSSGLPASGATLGMTTPPGTGTFIPSVEPDNPDLELDEPTVPTVPTVPTEASPESQPVPGVSAEPLDQNELTSDVPALDWNPLLEPGSNARIGDEFAHNHSGDEHAHDHGDEHADEAEAGNHAAAFGPRTAKFDITLVTVQLSGKTKADVNAINLGAVRESIKASSDYWSSMSNGRISMSIGREILGRPSAAKITDSYEQIMATVTNEMKWVSQPQKALVVFVPHADLNYRGTGGILGGGFTDGALTGRVVMPYPSALTENVVTHEFGHVLGLHHANSLYCSNGRLDTIRSGAGWSDPACRTAEYADTMDLMGYAQVNSPVINSFLWEYGGFGRGNEIRNLGKISGSTRHTLTAWSGTAANRAVKFTDPKTNETYYIELRLPVGRDAPVAVGGNRGVKIVKKDLLGWDGNASLQLTPDTRWTGYYNPNQTWQPGSTFITQGGTKVRVNSVSTTSADITITGPGTGLEPTFGAAAARTPGLGAATGPVTCGLHAGGCYQPFAGGNIYYTAATGAHAVTGAYFNAWRNAGWQMKIGYPTSTPICGLHAGGCYQPFTGGNIYYTPATGAHAVTGAYFNAWRNAGWQMKIGYPTSTPICGLHAGGCYQPFTGGNIYYTPATGAHAVTGAYFNAWRNAGWQMEIGYPTSTPICGLHAGGCYQPFTGGNIYYTPATGAHAVTGAYFNAWRNAGWQMKIGYPLAQATTKGGYRTVEFEKARITWTATGTRTTYK